MSLRNTMKNGIQNFNLRLLLQKNATKMNKTLASHSQLEIINTQKSTYSLLENSIIIRIIFLFLIVLSVLLIYVTFNMLVERKRKKDLENINRIIAKEDKIVLELGVVREVNQKVGHHIHMDF